MIHGVIQDGAILPIDPIPPEWGDGRSVVIEAAESDTIGQRSEIEAWYAGLETLGVAQYQPGEREAIEKTMADADQEAKEHMRRTWAHFDDNLPPGHKPPQRGTER